MAARMTLYKLVVLGDGGVGKVCQVLVAENAANALP
jgi:GTPase SAR1 family protein